MLILQVLFGALISNTSNHCQDKCLFSGRYVQTEWRIRSGSVTGHSCNGHLLFGGWFIYGSVTLTKLLALICMTLVVNKVTANAELVQWHKFLKWSDTSEVTL